MLVHPRDIQNIEKQPNTFFWNFYGFTSVGADSLKTLLLVHHLLVALKVK
jgi:hypothetical protein